MTDPAAEAPRKRSWSLRHYMALFVTALLVVAASAALYVRVQSEQDARQAAQGDAAFAANVAAKSVSDTIVVMQATTKKLAANPALPGLLAAPGSPCTLTFSVGAVSTGHLDVVSPEGSVVCSSEGLPRPQIYSGASWLAPALTTPTLAAPYMDPSSGSWVVAVTAPIAGKGAVAAFIQLGRLSTNLTEQYGGTRRLEFLITTGDGHTVVGRSIDPGRWIGASTTGKRFASSAGTVERPDLNGTQRIYGTAAVAAANWRMFAGADEAAAVAAADQLANRDLAIILAGVAVVLVVMLVVYRRVTEPIRELNQRVRLGASVGEGERMSPHSASEIAALSADFDRLMDTVKRELAERLRSEHSARISERNFRTLFVGHPQPMWLYDVSTLAFIEVNDAAVEQYGYSRDEFFAMTIKDIRPPEDVPKFLELIVDTPTFDRSGPWRHMTKAGTITQVLVTSHAVDFGGRQARFVMAEDLTESQRLELELHQSQARAEANAELSRAKDELVSMVSHELRTPLASVVGFTELLLSRDVSDDQRKEYLGVMLQEGRRLTSLINDFLDLQRIEGGHETMNVAPADLRALIARAVAMAGDAPGTPIETRLPADLPLALVDSDAILRVLANLLSNARKYSPDGGAIVVGAGLSAGMVEVYVQDHGLGVPREALPHLTQTFYRVDGTDRRNIRGTGLGLAISKKIIDAHGGTIGARSEGVGKGSLLHFTVPLARDRAKSGDVLIVEDDAGFAHLLAVELASKGLSSVWAADAETAENLTKQRMTRAVVLDLLLPGLQGEDYLSRLRASHGPGVPVVIVTVKNLEPDESLALQRAGVTAVLRKGAGTAEAAASLIAQAVVPELVSR